MKLTPLEIRQKRFQTTFRGYDCREVEEFLLVVSEEMEDLVREINAQRDRVHQQEKELTEFKDREKALKETLITAQKMSEEMRRLSEREARMALSNAELEGERIIHDVIRRRETLIGEIHDLKRQKVQFETTLRSAIEVHLKMLEALRERDEERTPEEENLSFLRRKAAEPASSAHPEGAEQSK